MTGAIGCTGGAVLTACSLAGVVIVKSGDHTLVIDTGLAGCAGAIAWAAMTGLTVSGLTVIVVVALYHSALIV